MKYLFSFIAFIFITDLSSQTPDENLDFLFPGDSIPTNTFMLDEVQVFQPLRFNNDDEIKRYVILRYRVKKVYPYAKLSADRMNIIDSRLSEIESKRKRRRYLKQLEKFTYDEFSAELKKLSR